MQERIATLDGWRCVAILLVLLDHFQPDTFPLPRLGIHGVTIFFVLSGFLITSKLMKEKSETGRIALGAFYKRRMLRLMPCAWAYLLVVFALRAFGHIAYWGELLSCLLFYRNYYPVHQARATTGHFWSLAIEEQFYLFWPCALALLGIRRARWIAAAGVCVGIAYRLAHERTLAADSIVPRLTTPVHVPALLIGCLMALLLQSERVARAVKRLPSTVLMLALVMCIATAGEVVSVAECIVIALLMAGGAARTDWLSRVLEHGAVAQIGLWSYSLYVWQQLPMLFYTHQTHFLGLKLVAVFALSLASYYGIERPFRRARKPRIGSLREPPPLIGLNARTGGDAA